MVQCLALLICVVTIVYVFSMRMGNAGWYLIGDAVLEGCMQTIVLDRIILVCVSTFHEFKLVVRCMMTHATHDV